MPPCYNIIFILGVVIANVFITYYICGVTFYDSDVDSRQGIYKLHKQCLATPNKNKFKRKYSRGTKWVIKLIITTELCELISCLSKCVNVNVYLYKEMPQYMRNIHQSCTLQHISIGIYVYFRHLLFVWPSENVFLEKTCHKIFSN